MDIMLFFGVTKKGGEKPTEPVKVKPSRSPKIIDFSDKHPRQVGEAFREGYIWTIVIL